ncbi:hypothetical protein KBC03_02205 [Patescibacteria group bacterium]|nr:hypothetical protein [Patescibacteria group bacterium]
MVGVSGIATSEDALSGLTHFLPGRLMKLSGLIGILAIISPHLLIGEHFIDTLKQSFRFHTFDARMTVTLLPLIAYIYLQTNFIGTIGFS